MTGEKTLAKLRYGMVGGGEGAFIGPVHRTAAELDGRATLVCGTFASDATRSRSSGERIYNLPPDRCYDNYAALFAGEAKRPTSERMQFVVVVTPNHLHVPVSIAALEAGFHVVCDKPLSVSLASSEVLADAVAKSGLLFCLTHNYTGYPMVAQARHMVSSGALGAIRRVSCEYLQGWLATAEESTDNKQAQWRTDPARSGAAGCFGDIGSHGENLIRYVTGLEVEAVCADLSTFVPGRALDDDGNVLLRFSGGARGVLSASQIAVGEENSLTLKVYGEEGGLTWSQMAPNSLVVRRRDQPAQVLRTGGAGVSVAAARATRLPAGHPEGYLEAFANVYGAFFDRLVAQLESAEESVEESTEGTTAQKLPPASPRSPDYPGVQDALAGMRFIDRVVASHRAGGLWMAV